MERTRAIDARPGSGQRRGEHGGSVCPAVTIFRFQSSCICRQDKAQPPAGLGPSRLGESEDHHVASFPRCSS